MASVPSPRGGGAPTTPSLHLLTRPSLTYPTVKGNLNPLQPLQPLRYLFLYDTHPVSIPSSSGGAHTPQGPNSPSYLRDICSYMKLTRPPTLAGGTSPTGGCLPTSPPRDLMANPTSHTLVYISNLPCLCQGDLVKLSCDSNLTKSPGHRQGKYHI